MNKIAAQAINTLATSVLLCLSFTAQAQYNPNIQQNYQGGLNPQDWQSSAAGAAAAASAAASSGMNAANNAANSAVHNAAASYQQNASAQFLQSSAPVNAAPANAFSQTGYSNDGTLFMGGQKIGNPHQALHDLNVPSFFGVNADRLTFTDNPSYGSGTLAQMENHTLTIGVPAGNVILSRLYLTPTNPYTEGVATPHNNFQTYQAVVAGAQAGSYQLTVANDNKLYAFKTLGSASPQSQNILIKELPAHSVFIANSDPKGGAVAVRVTQSGDYAAMQNYFATVKPYDFSWRSAMGAWADGVNRPSNITTELGQFGGMPISNNEAGAVFANWVQGSSQVQTYQANLQSQSAQSGNEAFGVLAWDANQNRYVMLDATNQQATAGSVSGNMPTLQDGQTAFFGMHTHQTYSIPTGQDYAMTQQLGLDQIIVGESNSTAVFALKPSNNWQGQEFRFEGIYGDAFRGNSASGKSPGTVVGNTYKATGDDSSTNIIAGEPRGGSFHLSNVITLDPTLPAINVAYVLAHEAAGHATENPVYLGFLPYETVEQYAERVVNAQLYNEARATLLGVEAENKIGLSQRTVDIIDSYEKGLLSRESALEKLADSIGDYENPSNEPSKTYRVYYKEIAISNYNNPLYNPPIPNTPNPEVDPAAYAASLGNWGSDGVW